MLIPGPIVIESLLDRAYQLDLGSVAIKEVWISSRCLRTAEPRQDWSFELVAHWSWMRCAAALGIIPGETYREPQASSGEGFRQPFKCCDSITATSGKLQATSNKQQATSSLTK